MLAKWILALSFLVTGPLATADDIENIHQFFKGRRALQEGVAERIEPNSQDNPYAKQVAEALAPCVHAESSNGNTFTNELKGPRCPLTSKKVEVKKFENSIYSTTSTLDINVTAAQLVAYASVSKTAPRENMVAHLRKVSESEYEATRVTLERQDVSVSTVFGNVTVVEKMSLNIETEVTNIAVTASAGNQSISGEYTENKGQASCKFAGRAIDCATLLYIFGYDKDQMSLAKLSWR